MCEFFPVFAPLVKQRPRMRAGKTPRIGNEERKRRQSARGDEVGTLSGIRGKRLDSGLFHVNHQPEVSLGGIEESAFAPIGLHQRERRLAALEGDREGKGGKAAAAAEIENRTRAADHRQQLERIKHVTPPEIARCFT